MVGHRQVAFFVTVIPSRQNRSANNELIFCENPIYHIDLIYYLISIFDALYWLKKYTPAVPYGNKSGSEKARGRG